MICGHWSCRPFLRSPCFALPAAVFILFAFASGDAPITKISPDGEFLSFMNGYAIHPSGQLKLFNRTLSDCVLPKERNQRKRASRFRSTALALNSFSWSEG
jgi:hypothetical protein